MHATSDQAAPETYGLVIGRLLLWSVLSLVVTALVVLAGHQLQERGFWPIVLAPAALGLLAGWGYGVLARAARAHYPWICAVLALMMATAGDLVLFRLAYDQYRSDFTSAVGKTQQSGQGLDDLGALITAPSNSSSHNRSYADRYLETQTGRRGFRGFVLWRTQEGMQIGGLRVRGFGMVMVWVIEWLAWASASAAVVVWYTKQPYCAGCQSWYDRRSRGRLTPEAQENLVQALHLEETRSSDVTRQEAMEYDFLACSEGCSPPMFVLELLSADSARSASRRVIFKSFLQPHQRETIESILLAERKTIE